LLDGVVLSFLHPGDQTYLQKDDGDDLVIWCLVVDDEGHVEIGVVWRE